MQFFINRNTILKLNKKDQEAFNHSCEIMKQTIKNEIESVLKG